MPTAIQVLDRARYGAAFISAKISCKYINPFIHALAIPWKTTTSKSSPQGKTEECLQQKEIDGIKECSCNRTRLVYTVLHVTIHVHLVLAS